MGNCSDIKLDAKGWDMNCSNTENNAHKSIINVYHKDAFTLAQIKQIAREYPNDQEAMGLIRKLLKNG